MIEGYECISACRLGKSGGGVSVYVRTNLSYRIIPEYKIVTYSYECIYIECADALFYVVYRPPSGSIESFLNFTEKVLDRSSDSHLQTVLVGYFNTNVLIYNPCFYA